MAFKSLGQAVYYLYLPSEGGGDIKRGRYWASDDTDLNHVWQQNGIVSQIYPLQGNEEAMGLNMLEHPARRREGYERPFGCPSGCFWTFCKEKESDVPMQHGRTVSNQGNPGTWKNRPKNHPDHCAYSQCILWRCEKMLWHRDEFSPAKTHWYQKNSRYHNGIYKAGKMRSEWKRDRVK